ncbi:MAG: hypothetical protein AAF754_20275, partial [Pseudomonadota bacterium]
RRVADWIKSIFKSPRAKEIDKVLEASQRPYKTGQFTVAGRALTKHPNIVGAKNAQELVKTLGNQAKTNSAAQKAVDDNVRNGVRNTKTTNAYGKVVDVKLSNGLGVRVSAQDKSFIGFLGRGVSP